MVTHPDNNPVQQGLTSVNKREPVFPFGDSRTIVDVFITNIPYLRSKTKVIKSALRTGHLMVLACPKDHVKSNRYTKAFRDVREHYKIKMSKLLEEYKWSSALSTQCIKEKVQNFQCALMQMYNDYFPVRTVLKSSRDPPFMLPLVKHLLKRGQVLFRKGWQKQNPTVTILQERTYNPIRENQLQAVKYHSNKRDKGTRSWWSTINFITRRKSICQSIAGFHMTSLNFKLQNYWSSWNVTFMINKSC